MAKMYYDNDANLELLKGKKIAVIGYGSQGHAHALNLRDSGIDVIVAEKQGTPNWDQALKDGFNPQEAQSAVQQDGVSWIQMLVPDTTQKAVFEDIRPFIENKKDMEKCLAEMISLKDKFGNYHQKVKPEIYRLLKERYPQE